MARTSAKNENAKERGIVAQKSAERKRGRAQFKSAEEREVKAR